MIQEKPKKFAQDYTTKELIASFICNTMEDGLTVMVGAGIPVPRAGILLAHLTHGPNMKVSISMTKTNLFYERDLKSFEFTADYRGSIYGEGYFIHNESFDDLKFRKNLVFFCGGLQFDKYGNSNLVGIGKDYKHLNFRGPGGVGVGDMCAFCKWYYLYTTSHDKRIFVESVDYITCFGWGEGGADARKKLGLPGGGPRYCITPLCIMDFEEKTKRMRLKSVHPGVTVDEVVKNTGFELIIPEQVPTTEPPTEGEIEILRTRIDLDGVLRK